jgi:hypothetical protein
MNALKNHTMSLEQEAPLSWKAPRTLRVSSFFSQYGALNWNKLEDFFRLSESYSTAEQHLEKYISHLERIAACDTVPERVREWSKQLVVETNHDEFKTRRALWSIQSKQKLAAADVAEGFSNTVVSAGSLFKSGGTCINALTTTILLSIMGSLN